MTDGVGYGYGFVDDGADYCATVIVDDGYSCCSWYCVDYNGFECDLSDDYDELMLMVMSKPGHNEKNMVMVRLGW